MKDFDSFMECERLSRFGRFSFNKFNKDVEVGLKWPDIGMNQLEVYLTLVLE